ncbi:uncharacterized protein LOC136077122 [Hydra vulgaris]|uniref:Uncharacterized protein LOC136077122 n=1 Tax=Hydra vulgaris TaxID=6087 RepID=A0ABM4BFT7_HYDVU
MAIKYDLKDNNGKTPRNAGQIIKELLQNQSEISLTEFFQIAGESNTRVRCKKIRLDIDKSASLPQEESNFMVTERMKRQIHEKKYLLGELVVPKSFEKSVIKEKNLEKEVFTV